MRKPDATVRIFQAPDGWYAQFLDSRFGAMGPFDTEQAAQQWLWFWFNKVEV